MPLVAYLCSTYWHFAFSSESSGWVGVLAWCLLTCGPPPPSVSRGVVDKARARTSYGFPWGCLVLQSTHSRRRSENERVDGREGGESEGKMMGGRARQARM